jgi:hypothetical protein
MGVSGGEEGARRGESAYMRYTHVHTRVSRGTVNINRKVLLFRHFRFRHLLCTCGQSFSMHVIAPCLCKLSSTMHLLCCWLLVVAAYVCCWHSFAPGYALPSLQVCVSIMVNPGGNRPRFGPQQVLCWTCLL